MDVPGSWFREDASREGVRDLPEWLQPFTEELTGGASSSEKRSSHRTCCVGSIPRQGENFLVRILQRSPFSNKPVGNTVNTRVLRKTPIARYASARKLQERLAEEVWKAKWT